MPLKGLFSELSLPLLSTVFLKPGFSPESNSRPCLHFDVAAPVTACELHPK